MGLCPGHLPEASQSRLRRGQSTRGAAPRLRAQLAGLQVAAKALETGVFGAYFNVLINLKDITDQDFKEQVSQQRVDPAW